MHRIDILREDAATILAARGELDLYATPELELAFERAAYDEHGLVVDLASVTFMDSSALGTVVRGVRQLEDAGRGVRVVLPRGSARRVFELTTVERMLSVAASRADAVSQLAAAGDV